MQMKKYIIVLLTSVILAISGCGFKLRGTTQLPVSMKKIHLQTSNPFGELSRLLKLSLQQSGAHLMATAQDADNVLVILGETPSQQLISISSTQLTRQYNIILTVTFEITDRAGKVLIAPLSLSETRNLTIQSDQILGGSNEENNLYSQMRKQLAFAIMSRLGSTEVASQLAAMPRP